jgi:hypothetical protein
MIGWIIFALCVSAMVVLFVGGLCHSAGRADEEMDGPNQDF